MAGLATVFGSGAMTNSFDEILKTDLLFVIGSNATEAHPIVGAKMLQAVRNGKKLIVVDPRRIELAERADYWLQIKPGTDIPLLNGLMHIIIKEDLYDKTFIEERTEGFEELKVTVEKYTPEKVSEMTGVPVDALYEVARLYATTRNALICYTLGITEHVCGVYNVMSIANLAMLTGHIGREGSGVNPLRGQNNVQGACDMGTLPNVLPGYQPVTSPEARAKFAQAWEVDDLPARVGLTIPDMMDAAVDGKLKAMYIMGEDPALTDPDTNYIKKALSSLDFLVVQEIFMTETAKYADVILPGATFAEKDGTFTNSERRVQRVRKAIEPIGNTMADWQIICKLAECMGYAMNYDWPGDIFDEMACLTPSYAGMNYQRLDAKGLQWPCPTLDHPGTPILHTTCFTRGKGLFKGIDHVPPAEMPDADYPFLLSTGRILYHYNVTTRYSAGLKAHRPEEMAQINPEDASRLGVSTGDRVRVTSRRGSVVTKVEVTDRVPPGMVWMSFHHKESPTNVLTASAFDPISKTGEYKVAAVKLEKYPRKNRNFVESFPWKNPF